MLKLVMKKLLLLLLLVVAYNNLFAFLSQGHWRWRKDDGSETSATWLANQDEMVTISDISQNIRLRVELYNDDPNTNDPKDAVLQYALDGTDTWFTITTTAGSNAFVLAGTSPNVTDLEPTTQQINGVGLTFESGKVLVSTDKIPSDVVSAHAETEYEYCIKPTSAIAPNTTYQFRVEATNHNPGFTNPKLKTEATLPVTFTSFALQQKDNGVKIMWTTGTEQNNDHFAVQRSPNGSTWQTITTVQADGISNRHTYEVFDENPAAGKNYYRVVQYDKDGKSLSSGVKDISVSLKQLISAVVSPNPVVNDINLSIKNYTGLVNVVLASANGKVVLKQAVNVNSGIANYTIKIPSKPAAGMYILQLTGDDFKKSISVIIQ